MKVACEWPECPDEATHRHAVGQYPKRALYHLCRAHRDEAMRTDAVPEGPLRRQPEGDPAESVPVPVAVEAPTPTTPAERSALVLDPRLTVAFCEQVVRILDLVREHPDVEVFARDIVKNRKRALGERRAKKARPTDEQSLEPQAPRRQRSSRTSLPAPRRRVRGVPPLGAP